MYSVAKAFVAGLAVLGGAKAQVTQWVSSQGGFYTASSPYPSYSAVNCSFTKVYSSDNYPVQTVTILTDGTYQPDSGAFPAIGFLNVSHTAYTSPVSFSPAPTISISAYSADINYIPVIAKCSQSLDDGGSPTFYACQQSTPFNTFLNAENICMDLSQGPVECNLLASPCIGESKPTLNISLYSVNYTPDQGAFPIDGALTLQAGERASILFSDKTAKSNNLAQVAIANTISENADCMSRPFFLCKATNSTTSDKASHLALGL